MTARRVVRPSEVLPLIGRADRTRTRQQRRLDRAASIEDLRSMARRRTPRAVFDYTDGAAMSESTLERSRDAYARVEVTPRVLRDVSQVDLTTEIMGQRSNLPFAFAPTGFTRMMNHVGEPAVAQVAGERGIPYTLSTLGTTSIEALALAAPSTRRWFQLYVSRDRAAAEALMTRANDAGYDTLILTVDTAVGGIRRREVRGGLTIPPQLRLSTMADMARYPR
jgi:L-lactate dehydrogenase (cytochrome)